MTRREFERIVATVRRRLLRAVISESGADSEAGRALLHIAALGRTDWTAADWGALLEQLDSSQLTVDAWLQETAQADFLITLGEDPDVNQS